MASGTVTMTAVLSQFQRRRCAHVELTSSSTRGETPSHLGLPAPQSPVSLFRLSGLACYTENSQIEAALLTNHRNNEGTVGVS